MYRSILETLDEDLTVVTIAPTTVVGLMVGLFVGNLVGEFVRVRVRVNVRSGKA